MNLVKKKLYALLRYSVEKKAEFLFKSNKEFWDTLQNYISKSGSTGCSY